MAQEPCCTRWWSGTQLRSIARSCLRGLKMGIRPRSYPQVNQIASHLEPLLRRQKTFPTESRAEDRRVFRNPLFRFLHFVSPRKRTRSRMKSGAYEVVVSYV